MKTLLFIGLVTGLFSCTTMFRGETGDPKKRTFTLTGNVDGASVYLNGDSIGVTPIRFTIAKLNKADELTVKKIGYKDLYIWVERKANVGWTIVAWIPCVSGGILTFGLSCLGTLKDYRKGSFYDLKETTYTFDMEKI